MVEIKQGDTIVYKHEDGSMMFYWLCDTYCGNYVFFSWYGDVEHAASTDFWRMSREWLETKVKEGKIEIYDSLPMDKYGNIFNQQMIDRFNF